MLDRLGAGVLWENELCYRGGGCSTTASQARASQKLKTGRKTAATG